MGDTNGGTGHIYLANIHITDLEESSILSKEQAFVGVLWKPLEV